MAIVNSEENSDSNKNKRKRSGTGQSMASDSGYAEDADGELKDIIQSNGVILIYSYNENFQESKITRRSQDITKLKTYQDTFDMLFIHGSVTKTKS